MKFYGGPILLKLQVFAKECIGVGYEPLTMEVQETGSQTKMVI